MAAYWTVGSRAHRDVELAEADITLGRDYPLPVVDHAAAREKTLARYGILKKEA